MVDCGNPRCIHDKRSVRKDLMSWSKKIPLLLGLEAILEQFAGRRLSSLLLQPLIDTITRKPLEDWTPDTKCSYCGDNGLNKLEPADCDSGSDIERSTHNTTIESIVDKVKDAPTDGAFVGDLSYLSDAPSEVDAAEDKTPEVTYDPLQPVPPPDIPHPPTVPASQCHTKYKKLSGKRTYSEEELTIAIREIQNGKIGTRRASSLYGIPRSTLRNKIFKLELKHQESPASIEETEDPSHSLPPSLPALPPSVDATMRYTDLAQYNPFLFISPYVFPTVFPYTYDYIKPSFAATPLSHDINFGNLDRKDDIESRSADSKLDQIRKKHNLATLCRSHEQGNAVMIDPQLLSQPCAQQLKHTILPSVIRKLAQQRLELERSTTDFKRSLDDLIIAQQLDSDLSDTDSDQSVQSLSNRPLQNDRGSYPMLSTFNSIIGRYYGGLDSLNHKPAKNFTDAVKSHESNGVERGIQGLDERTSLSNGNKRGKSAFSVPCGSPNKKSKKSITENRRENVPADKPSDSGVIPLKKTRPKRGQYRKYNSQLLTEAVKSVQRGEMSVHRAGSYYGVPHSTLEYKVKERHLLRQKKVKDNHALKESSGRDYQKSSSGSPILSECSTQSTSPIASNKELSTSVLPFPDWLKQSNAFPSTSIFSVSSDLTLNTPASELLKKLQQKVKNNSNNLLAESGGFFSSGLDLQT